MAKDPDAEKDEVQEEGDVTGVNVGAKSWRMIYDYHSWRMSSWQMVVALEIEKWDLQKGTGVWRWRYPSERLDANRAGRSNHLGGGIILISLY
jgi:hypothetical protein